ncbi:uncharacterized protein LOC143711848 isoform X2 [Siphateles boraxobius]|uniref:uncharacterized protein LOC143711848 isoform X2 n=1 Tax=Siphateles boraxobius TaxID=180520 RepID=UPI004063E08A
MPTVSTAASTQIASRMDTQTLMNVISTTETPTYTRTDHTDCPNTPHHPQNKNYSLLIIGLVSTGVLAGLICLCWFACKKRRRHNKMRPTRSDGPNQGIGMSSGPAETYSLITSVPVTSRPISVVSNTHQDSTPDPTATYSSIMSENSICQPSGVLVNKQQKEGNTKENENVYHLYCTIPDKPVHSKAGDQDYSLVNH